MKLQEPKEWLVPSEFGREKRIMLEIAAWIERFDGDCPRKEDILTAIAEACLNAFEHGNRLNRERLVKVSMAVAPNEYKFRIFDEGKGYSCTFPAEAPLYKNTADDPRGWGLYLIRALADAVCCGWENGQFYTEMRFFRAIQGLPHITKGG